MEVPSERTCRPNAQNASERTRVLPAVRNEYGVARIRLCHSPGAFALDERVKRGLFPPVDSGSFRKELLSGNGSHLNIAAMYKHSSAHSTGFS